LNEDRVTSYVEGILGEKVNGILICAGVMVSFNVELGSKGEWLGGGSIVLVAFDVVEGHQAHGSFGGDDGLKNIPIRAKCGIGIVGGPLFHFLDYCYTAKRIGVQQSGGQRYCCVFGETKEKSESGEQTMSFCTKRSATVAWSWAGVVSNAFASRETDRPTKGTSEFGSGAVTTDG
jgi:hypothetical protein